MEKSIEMYKEIYKAIRANFLFFCFLTLGVGVIGIAVLANFKYENTLDIYVVNQIKTWLFLLVMFVIPADHFFYNKKVRTFSKKDKFANILSLKDYYKKRMIVLTSMISIQIGTMVLIRDRSMFYTFLIILFYFIIIYPVKNRVAKDVLLNEDEYTLLD
ncbi:MAG: hypothetical protein JEZ03_02360 [Bacteroidales bacterium]|nr:hypothetical protein [Bacteroidales bacterium]